jgi:hypothetical protein
MDRILKINDRFTPYPIVDGDELFENGFFVFNITKMIDYIQNNPDAFVIEEVAVKDSYTSFSSINESHVDSVDTAKPVIFAEISPGQYNLIDGNHRMEKARRLGISSVLAYRLNMEQHIQFLTSKKAYLAYVEYWNNKLKEARRSLRAYQKYLQSRRSN